MRSKFQELKHSMKTKTFENLTLIFIISYSISILIISYLISHSVLIFLISYRTGTVGVRYKVQAV